MFFAPSARSSLKKGTGPEPKGVKGVNTVKNGRREVSVPRFQPFFNGGRVGTIAAIGVFDTRFWCGSEFFPPDIGQTLRPLSAGDKKAVGQPFSS